jgi:Domain of unknown function (DUF5703)
MKKYNVIWNSQSEGSMDSMPLGGYDTGCNVWVEEDKIYLYISQSGTFDENATMLKMARICIWLEDAPEIMSKNFRQELHLEEGYITIDAGEGQNKIHIKLWAAVSKPEIHVEYESNQLHTLMASLENWRYREREITKNDVGQCRDFDFGYPGKRFTYPDEIELNNDELCFFHKNKNTDTAWDVLIHQQRLAPIQNKIPNPLKNRIMGGILKMGGMTYLHTYEGEYAGVDFKGYAYQANQTNSQAIIVTLHTECCDTIESWRNQLNEKRAVVVNLEDTQRWWNRYYNQSYIHIDLEEENSKNFQIGRNYALFRYMLGCNYYGEYPTKFNGGLFTFDEGRTPDFRMWSGGGFTSQNQRLVYWGMLKSGDFEGMRPQLDYFKNLTEAAKARVQHFFGHKGAFFFEQGNIFGICTGAEYGWNHSKEISDGLEDNPWVRLHFSTGLEFALMMLEYSRYCKKPIDEYMDYIENIIEFYMEYYTYENDKLLIYPATALETYKGQDPHSKDDKQYGCTNPTDAIAGLRCVLNELIDFCQDNEKKEKYINYLKKCPEIPTGINQEGNEVFLPAQIYGEKPFNCELPELYPIYPYSPYGLTNQEEELGKNTYLQEYANKDMYLSCSWHQNGIFAARLGIVEDAFKYLYEKLENAPKRFPAFWGPGHDWTPDHNHGGSGMIQLQEMLMNCEKEKIKLFPCWDKKIDVSFKLYAPNDTIVECVLKKGEVIKLDVVPQYRIKDIEI